MNTEQQGLDNAGNDPEYEAALQFQKEHGYVPREERERQLGEIFSGEKAERWVSLREKLDGFEKELAALPAVKRLHFIEQLSGKASPASEPRMMAFGAQSFTRAFHTRFEHSELIGLLASAAAIQIGATDEEAKIMVAGGWLHDIGHSVFSHSGDSLLVGRGWPDHEERGIQTIEKDQDIQDFLIKEGLPADRVVDVIKEKAGAGALQSMLDTLSYLDLDSGMIGKPLVLDSGARFIADLQGIDPVRKALRVQTPELWQELLEMRAAMMHDVYYHPANMRIEEAKKQLMRIAMKEGLLTTEEISKAGDSVMLQKLQSLVQVDPAAARWAERTDTSAPLTRCKELFGVAIGFYDSSKWQRRLFATKTEAENFLYGLSSAAIEQSLLIRPHDYTKKSLLVIAPDGTESVLRAKNTKLHLEDEHYVVYAPI